MKLPIYVLALLSLLLDSLPALALTPGDRVDNFQLLDQNGESHELYYLSDMAAVVVMVHGNGCPIVRNALPTLKEIRIKYESQGVAFLLLNANLQDNRESIHAEAAEFLVDFPIMVDETQLIAESLGVVRTAEVFVIDPKTWKLAYRGPIDDRLAYGAQKPKASEHYLVDALDAIVAGEPVKVAQAESMGCLVNLPEQDRRAKHAQISYSEQVAPILIDRCVTCHRKGGVGPWAMTRHEMVQGFAPMIREVVRTKRMPPWHPDPHYGKFVDQRGIANDDAKTLVHWIEAGAPRGDGPDPLKALNTEWGEWTLGTPDLIVEVPAFDVPATGVVDYMYPVAENPLDHDVWVRAIEIVPGDRSVVHHVLASVEEPDRGRRRIPGNLGGYSPGKNAVPYPDNTGVLVRKGANFWFQMHYTPSGKAVTDVTRIGLYFYDEPPKHALDMELIYDTSLTIPANAKAYHEQLDHVFEQDIMLYSLLPHAHLRGRAAKFTAHYPGGRNEILLSVPKYDFNWQPLYALDPPKFIPAGTRVVLDMTWDNSAQNPANPDPDQTVFWGDQTWEEMNVGWFRYRLADDNDRRKAEAGAPSEKSAHSDTRGHTSAATGLSEMPANMH
jgi:peroxiredoxin